MIKKNKNSEAQDVCRVHFDENDVCEPVSSSPPSESTKKCSIAGEDSDNDSDEMTAGDDIPEMESFGNGQTPSLARCFSEHVCQGMETKLGNMTSNDAIYFVADSIFGAKEEELAKVPFDTRQEDFVSERMSIVSGPSSRKNSDWSNIYASIRQRRGTATQAGLISSTAAISSRTRSPTSDATPPPSTPIEPRLSKLFNPPEVIKKSPSFEQAVSDVVPRHSTPPLPRNRSSSTATPKTQSPTLLLEFYNAGAGKLYYFDPEHGQSYTSLPALMTDHVFATLSIGNIRTRCLIHVSAAEMLAAAAIQCQWRRSKSRWLAREQRRAVLDTAKDLEVLKSKMSKGVVRHGSSTADRDLVEDGLNSLKNRKSRTSLGDSGGSRGGLRVDPSVKEMITKPTDDTSSETSSTGSIEAQMMHTLVTAIERGIVTRQRSVPKIMSDNGSSSSSSGASSMLMDSDDNRTSQGSNDSGNKSSKAMTGSTATKTGSANKLDAVLTILTTGIAQSTTFGSKLITSWILDDEYFDMKARDEIDGKTKFKEFSPVVFRHLRAHFGVNERDMQAQLSSQNIRLLSQSAGRSGSYFLLSENNLYMLKSVTKTESILLRDLMPSYYRYMTINPHSLLTRFLGSYTLQIGTRKLRFVVMSNIFATRPPFEAYDLKGSFINRSVVKSETEITKGMIMKDNDLRRPVFLPSKLRSLVLMQLQRDTEWLVSKDIMDYSLLIGITYDNGQPDMTVYREDPLILQKEECAVSFEPPVVKVESRRSKRNPAVETPLDLLEPRGPRLLSTDSINPDELIEREALDGPRQGINISEKIDKWAHQSSSTYVSDVGAVTGSSVDDMISALSYQSASSFTADSEAGSSPRREPSALSASYLPRTNTKPPAASNSIDLASKKNPRQSSPPLTVRSTSVDVVSLSSSLISPTAGQAPKMSRAGNIFKIFKRNKDPCASSGPNSPSVSASGLFSPSKAHSDEAAVIPVLPSPPDASPSTNSNHRGDLAPISAVDDDDDDGMNDDADDEESAAAAEREAKKKSNKVMQLLGKVGGGAAHRESVGRGVSSDGLRLAGTYKLIKTVTVEDLLVVPDELPNGMNIFQQHMGGVSGVYPDQVSRGETYYFGLIDMLQKYDLNKQMENGIKRARGQDSQGISCIKTEDYANRFMKFMALVFEEA